MLIWFFASFSFGSLSFAGSADPAAGHDHMQMLSTHEAMPGGPPQTPDMPVGHDHAAMQCCMTFCASSWVGALQNEAFVKLRTASVHVLSTDTLRLPLLYLDSDPPVPKA